MTDVLTSEQRSYNMSRIRGRNTKPELLLREALKGLRLRYQPKIFGKPDFASRKHRVAIFVDGCFWHGCPECFVKPATNKEFWERKIEKNIRRDKEVSKRLESEGWKVYRIWEHKVKHNLDQCTNDIRQMIGER